MSLLFLLTILTVTLFDCLCGLSSKLFLLESVPVASVFSKEVMLFLISHICYISATGTCICEISSMSEGFLFLMIAPFF